MGSLIKLSSIYPYRYIIDTSSILSQNDKEPYRRKVFMRQWEKVDELISKKIIVTCSEIYSEINDDIILDRMKALQLIVLPIDDEVQSNVKKVVTAFPQLIDFKQAKSSGDAFLIATAIKYGLKVITEESKNSDKKIPFVCKKSGIQCMNIVELWECEGWAY